MLNSIELRNWKTHKLTKLSFSRGTNILLGQMGAGKSTIMDAISFALFGTYPALQHRRTSVASIIANRPERMRSASVRLGFDIGGEDYEVERSLELKGPGKATLSRNGSYLQSQPERVNEEIERILKLDYDLFSRAVYSEQNRLTYFLELRPAERKKQIDELLGLDKFATAQENTTALVNRIKDMVSESEKTAATFDVEKLKEQHKSLEKELEKAREDKEELKEKLEKAEKERGSVEKELKKTKELYERKVSLAKEIEGLRSRLEIVSKEIVKYEKTTRAKAIIEKELREAKSSLVDLKEEEEDAEARSEASRKRLSETEATAKRLAKDAEEKERLFKELAKADRESAEKELLWLTEALKKANTELESRIASKKESEKWLAELAKHIGKCPICERELTEEMKKRIVDERSRTIRELDSGIAKWSNGVKELETRLDSKRKEFNSILIIIDKLSGLKEIEERFSAANADLEKATSTDKTSKKEAKAAQEAVSKAREMMKDIELEAQQAGKREELEELSETSKKELAAKEKEAKEISADKSGVEALQSNFTKLSSESSEFGARLSAAAASETDKAKQAEEKKREIDAVAEIYGEISRRKVIIDNLAKFRNALAETQAELRNTLVGSINEIMHEVWPELYPYQDYQSIRLDADVDDYLLKVKTAAPDGGAWENVESIASGGERTIACLAMRVALALVLAPNLKWLILDEPTHNLDQNGLSKFVKAINDVLPNIVEQVFIITHDETLKQVVNARMYILSRNKDESGTTSMEEI